MFTGIIQKTGEIKKIGTRNGIKILAIEPRLAKTRAKQRMLNPGDSIAVDGCCLTVTACTKKLFKVEAIPETLKHTIINKYRKGTIVNLENPLKIGDSLDGHFVQGHIDFVGTVLKSGKDGDSKILTISFPKNIAKYFALKGSVTVNGVSLTISKISKTGFEVSLIPQTLKTTNLNSLVKNDVANIEIDMIARYINAHK